MMKKLLLFLLYVLPLALAPSEANGKNALIVLTKDNVTHQFVLAQDKPNVTFEGTSLKVTCENASATAMFALSDVVRFYYKDSDPSGIDELNSGEDTGLNYVGGTLVISQVKAGETVGIYTTDGRLLQKFDAKRSGTYRLSLSSLPTGVYVVKTGTLTYKITKQ